MSTNRNNQYCDYSVVDYVGNYSNLKRLEIPEVVEEHGWSYVYDDFNYPGVYSPVDNIVVKFSDIVPHFFKYNPAEWHDKCETHTLEEICDETEYGYLYPHKERKWPKEITLKQILKKRRKRKFNLALWLISAIAITTLYMVLSYFHIITF